MPSWSGLFNGVYNQNHALIGTRTSSQHVIGVEFAKPVMRAQKELALTLNGAAAGQAASAVNKRVVAVQEIGTFALGGKRVIETETVVNRNTSAGDETALDGVIDMTFGLSTPAVDKSGNGGGNKVGKL